MGLKYVSFHLFGGGVVGAIKFYRQAYFVLRLAAYNKIYMIRQGF
jgi:hypothetical protein